MYQELEEYKRDGEGFNVLSYGPCYYLKMQDLQKLNSTILANN